MLSFPKYLSIQTTSICNASCVFCPSKDIKDLYGSQIMDMALYKKIIDECSGYKGIERVILYMNNEPLTDPYLIERINYAKEKLPQAGAHILTNGFLLTREMQDKLINSKLDWIGISFHGIRRETIEKSMGLPYDITLERINSFIGRVKEKKNIKDYLMITFLKHKYLSLEEKQEAVDFWKNRGVERISCFDGPVSRAGNVRDLEKVYKQSKVKGCNSIWADEMIHIVEDGKVVLCCMDWRREVVLGDLNKESIYSVWNGKRKQAWHMIYGSQDMPDDFLCRRCEEAVTLEPGSNGLDNLPKQDKVLLVVCPMWDVSLPPMGAAYLAAYLESKGISADIMDINAQSYADSDSKRRKLWKMENYNLWAWEDLFKEIKGGFEEDIDHYVEEILKKGCKVVGFSIYGANILFSIEVALRLKKRDPGLFIVFGGPSCFFLHNNPEMPVRCMVSFKTQKPLVKPGVVDAFVVGEGERVLHKLISSYFQGEVAPLRGAILYLNGRYTSFFSHPRIKNLDEIPYPAWDKLSLGRYSSKDTLTILLSRGCINRCAFCNDWKIWEEKYRHRSALNIFNEIKEMAEKFNIKTFQCNDLLFNGNLKMLKELAELLINSDVRIHWSAQGVIRRDMDFPLLRKLRKSGLDVVTYGVESLSGKVLEKMGKRYCFDDIQEVLKNTRKARIGVFINLIAGFPNETKEEFELTKSRLKQAGRYINEISSLNPCYITADTDLEKFYQDFSVTLPKESWDYYWQSQSGANNYETRRKRALELSELARSLGLRVRFTGIYDKNEQDAAGGCIAEVKDDYKGIDLLFINLAPWAQENPHIGIGYLSAYLRSKEIRFKVMDLNKSFYLNHPDFRMLWHVENKNFWSNPQSFALILKEFKRDIEEAVESVINSDCGILGFSVVDPKERITVEFIRRIKSRCPDKKIILGGPATSTPEQRQFFLDNAPGMVDAFVVGEGEAALYELLKKFLNNETALNVEGCCLEDNGKWVYRERIKSLSLGRAPYPTYEEFDLSLYGRSLLVEWSRGCRAKCAFCKNYRLFLDYRPKPASWVLDELRYHKQKRGISEFTVVDSILNGNLDNLSDICDKILKENLNIRWNGQIAPRKDMDLNFFKKMKQAGCFKLQIGLESGSDKVLRLMRKTFTSEISEQNIRFAKEAGIETEIFVITGFPGETEDDFKKTYDFIKRNSSYIDTIKSINTLHLIAGTEIYEEREKFAIKPLPGKDWHYLWETYDGNTYKVREKRSLKLLDLAGSLGVKVMEANIQEGKENFLQAKGINSLSALKDSINSLQDLPSKRKNVRSKRPVLKWLILVFAAIYTFFYIVYFWGYMIIRDKALLGGKRG